ncbi:hypothetical protein jhhlp_004862 [Lomentospora prolificans]|uniref:Oxidase ustYa n=1 Tax=Lomentospora prolificans TaxID=41688 RepID=A0A2N3N7Q1_9PEZI|nr:hypothetical protein jhhlp_004862 [Lomentospora prolificans]
MSHGQDRQDDEKEAFLEPSSPIDDAIPTRRRNTSLQRAAHYARWFLEIIMALTIAVLLVRPLDDKKATSPESSTKSSPVPTCTYPHRAFVLTSFPPNETIFILVPRKIYTFTEDRTYLREEMFFNRTETLRTLHNWIPLSSDSRGYVQFEDMDSYDLPQPYITPIDRISEGPGYMVSLYHQLHCLSYLVEHFQAGYSGMRLTEEIAHHTAHCFDYIRQAIMCAADTSLEGQTEFGPGWGSEHECKDYDAVLKWANEHATMKWRTNMPEEAIL